MILKRQFECDDIQETKVVNFAMKVIAILSVAAVVLFFFYSCVLYAFAKGRRWQKRWLANAAFSTVSIVLFYDSFTPLIINFQIPELVLEDIEDAKEIVATLVRNICFRISKKELGLHVDRDAQHNSQRDNRQDDKQDHRDQRDVQRNLQRDAQLSGQEVLRREEDVGEDAVGFSSSNYFFRSVVIILFCFT
jgi:hypothetical protein